MERRIITTDVLEEDVKIEGSLRPQHLDDYIGQEKTKKNLKVYIEAAKQRSDVLDHVLFYGPPGLGKTTLAGIIANEMGTHMKVTSGPAIEKPGEMAAILNNLQEGDVLFVDEIHRLNRQVEEVLYPAMEDFAIDIMIGKGSSARSIRLDLPKFTLVGATTRAGLLTAPLRDRFGVIHHLEFYTEEELANIILHSSKVLNVEVDPQGALEMARRSRGTPRLANRILKRVRDFAQVKYDGRITKEVASFALDLLEVDRYGLDQTDRLLLTTDSPASFEPVVLSIGESAVLQPSGLRVFCEWQENFSEIQNTLSTFAVKCDTIDSTTQILFRPRHAHGASGGRKAVLPQQDQRHAADLPCLCAAEGRRRGGGPGVAAGGAGGGGCFARYLFRVLYNVKHVT